MTITIVIVSVFLALAVAGIIAGLYVISKVVDALTIDDEVDE